MNHPELGSENDPNQELANRFINDMGIISRAIGVMSGGYRFKHVENIQKAQLRQDFKDQYPEITNHPLKGSKVKVTLLDESLNRRDMAIDTGYPWAGGEFIGEESVEGVLSDIYPGIGVYITKGPDPREGRFVHTTSYIDGHPTCDIAVLSLREP